MREAPALRMFFGDAERVFALDVTLIKELERVTGSGIGALFRRVIGGTYFIADVQETIRLALIGGGASPKEAAALCDTYTSRRPLAETLPLALSILDRVFLGASAEPENLNPVSNSEARP